MSDNISHYDEQYSTTQLLIRPFDDQLKFDENGKIKDGFKWEINNSTYNIQNSKLIGKPDDKFETVLFSPETEGCKGEGGLRTKGYFKFSYKKLMFNNKYLILNDKEGNKFKVDNSKLNTQHSTLDNTDIDTDTDTNTWWITDSNNKPIKPAPPEIQQKINQYTTNQYTNNQFTNNQLPLISIITVVLNGEKYLKETILSVINQNYPNVEYIIIDGGSTDGTLDIIKKYEHAIDYWVSEPDKGIYDAMNKGIKLITGKWVNFMNAGDKFFDSKILNILFNRNINNDVRLIYGKAYCENKLFGTNKIVGYEVTNINEFYYDIPICHQAIFHHINAFKTHGLFDLDYKVAADYLWLSNFFFENITSTKYFDQIIVNYGYGGFTSDNLVAAKKEKYKVSKKLFPNDIMISKKISILKLQFKLMLIKIMKRFNIYRYYIEFKRKFGAK